MFAPHRFHADWKGETVAIVATGPSLTDDDAGMLAAAHVARRVKIVAVNDAHRLCPFADLLYSGDWDWIDHHAGVPGFDGPKLTCLVGDAGGRIAGTDVCTRFRWAGAVSMPGAVLWPSGHTISQGFNSAFQAQHVALLRGAARLIFLGLDCRGSHFFGEHPKPLQKATPFDLIAQAFGAAARQLAERGVEAVNCSPQTALTCFPVRSLEETLR